MENSLDRRLFRLVEDVGNDFLGLACQMVKGFVGGYEVGDGKESWLRKYIRQIKTEKQLTLLVLQEVWSDKSMVDHDRSVVLNRQHAVDEKDRLRKMI